MIAPHLAEIDYREPILTFSLPVDGDNTVYGIFWISNLYWIEVLLLVCLNVLLATVTGAVVYKVIIEPGKTDTPIAKILGFGALLPFWITWPTTIFQLLDVRNLLFKFILGGVTPTITLFRVLEAIYGCCPPHATKSFQDFVVYFGSVLVFTRDEKTGDYVKASAPMKLMCLRKFVILLLITGLFQSILSPFPSMNVFGDPIGSNEWFTFARMTTWQLYANSLFHAVLFQLYLTTYCEGLIFFWITVTGYQTNPVMKNPLGGAKSPSDFWGKRWNLLIQGVLKGGVYKPVRKHGYSAMIAVFATFLASGLFHEWLAYGLFRTTCMGFHRRDSCYNYLPGGSMIFFIWQAVLIVGEFVLGKTAIVTYLATKLPLLARTVLIIAMGIPVAHFFTEPYVRSDYFRHGQMGLPMILQIER